MPSRIDGEQQNMQMKTVKRKSEVKRMSDAEAAKAVKGSLDPLVLHPGLYRAQLSCRIGRDALEGKTKPPCGTTPTEYALYNLLHAVDEIATAMMPSGGPIA